MSTLQALGVCLAALAVKVAFNTLCVVRWRLATSQLRDISEDSNKITAFLLNYVFRPLLLVMPHKSSSGSDADSMEASINAAARPPAEPDAGSTLGRLLRAHANSTEQEPWTIALALAYRIQTAHVTDENKIVDRPGMSRLGTIVLYVFTVARWLHLITYTLRIQPFRSIFFLTGLVCSVILAILVFIDVLP